MVLKVKFLDIFVALIGTPVRAVSSLAFRFSSSVKLFTAEVAGFWFATPMGKLSIPKFFHFFGSPSVCKILDAVGLNQTLVMV